LVGVGKGEPPRREQTSHVFLFGRDDNIGATVT
jgi:hypothetical protein